MVKLTLVPNAGDNTVSLTMQDVKKDYYSSHGQLFDSVNLFGEILDSLR